MDYVYLKQVLIDQQAHLELKSSEIKVVREVDLVTQLNFKEITVISGVRRSGKSSALRLLANEVRRTKPVLYVDFDDPRLSGFADRHFEYISDFWSKSEFGPEATGVFFFDEIQNVDKWERWVSFFSQTKGHKVFITGSNSNLLSSELATHLTGRHRDVEILPFSFFEIVKYQQHELLAQLNKLTSEKRALLFKLYLRYLKFGGFPRSYLDEDTQILRQYYSDIVIKDIARRKGVRDLQALLSVGNTLMQDTTRLLNKSKLARALGIKQQKTITNYCQYFVESYLTFELKKYDTSVKRTARSLPKFCAIDVALARSLSINEDSQMGANLENLVFLELRRRGLEINYWLSDEGAEVDFITRSSDSPKQAIQVCLSLVNKETEKREVQALLAVAKKYKISSLFIVTADERREINTGQNVIQVIPYYEWALKR